jgi:hypothetical protein
LFKNTHLGHHHSLEKETHDVRQDADRNDCDCDHQLCGPDDRSRSQEKPTMQTATPKPVKTGHAAVNGVNYYYAVYGTGEPLLLLHGGLGQIEMFGPNLAKPRPGRRGLKPERHLRLVGGRGTE